MSDGRSFITRRGSSTQYAEALGSGGIGLSLHSALPTADADNRGVPLRLEGAAGVADALAVPVKMSNGAYTTGRVRVDGVGYLLVRADAAFTLTNGTAAQAMFAAAGDALTVEAGQSYRFRVVARLTTGAISASVSFLFGGAATFTTVNYLALGINAASGVAAAPVLQNGEAATAVVVAAAGTGVNKRFWIEGEFEVNAAGTLIPQIQFSADPTGTLTTDVGSFFEAWPIGAAPVTTIGPWS